MTNKLLLSGLLAAVLSGVTASACLVQVRLACPNDTPAEGVLVCIEGQGCDYTDAQGIATIPVDSFGNHTIIVYPYTLPPGATLKVNQLKTNIRVENDAPPVVDIVLGGDFCSPPPPSGDCWLTGGGTVGKAKGTPNYSFGGVVYPGCSPKAAGGGNWNVIDHATGLHFQGQYITVDECSGVPTGSPQVGVNIIDFHGVGILNGIAGNPDSKVAVTFEGRAIDVKEGGAGSDQLYIKVLNGGSTALQIGTDADNPATISTGNLQIHTTGCGKYP